MKIPKGAKKKFDGYIFKVYEWNQKMYDGSSAKFEMAERRPSVDVIATAGDSIIVLRQQQPLRANPFFAMPGGMVNDDECPLDAAKRELLEETGYASDQFVLVGEYLGDSKVYFHEYQYVARGCQKVAEQNFDSGEKIELVFVDFEKFLQLCRDPEFTAPLRLKFRMYEALVSAEEKEKLRKEIFG